MPSLCHGHSVKRPGLEAILLSSSSLRSLGAGSLQTTIGFYRQKQRERERGVINMMGVRVGESYGCERRVALMEWAVSAEVNIDFHPVSR